MAEAPLSISTQEGMKYVPHHSEYERRRYRQPTARAATKYIPKIDPRKHQQPKPLKAVKNDNGDGCDPDHYLSNLKKRATEGSLVA